MGEIVETSTGASNSLIFELNKGQNEYVPERWSYFVGQVSGKVKLQIVGLVMPPMLFFAPVFVRSVAGRSPRPEEQNLVYYRLHLAFVH